jgi:hypothetical protein
VARLMSNLSSAIVFGAIYFRMGRSQSSIQDRLGLLQVRGCAFGVNVCVLGGMCVRARMCVRALSVHEGAGVWWHVKELRRMRCVAS